MPSRSLLLVIRAGLLLACLVTVALGLVLPEFHIKVLVSSTGGVVVGLLGAVSLRLAAKIEPAKLAQMDENIREAQRILNEGSFSRRLGLPSTPAIDPSDLNLTEMLRHPLFIFACATIATMVWFSPSFYSATATPWSATSARGVGAHFLALLFIAAAVLGIANKVYARGTR